MPSGELTVGLLLDRVGDKGFGLLLLVLALPSALPVPAAGYSVPFGILLLGVGLQMILRRPRPVFPSRLRSTRLPRGLMDQMLKAGIWFFGRIERWIRPRLEWIGGGPGRSLMGVLVVVMAILMIIPIPLTNTAPAMVIFLIGIGLTERDGLFALGACFLGVAAVALYAALVVALVLYGPEVITEVKDWIKALF